MLRFYFGFYQQIVTNTIFSIVFLFFYCYLINFFYYYLFRKKQASIGSFFFFSNTYLRFCFGIYLYAILNDRLFGILANQNFFFFFFFNLAIPIVHLYENLPANTLFHDS